MANLPMSSALTSAFTTKLASSLSLTKNQEMKAKSTALELSSKENLSNCDAFSIIRYCFEVARYDFGRDDCVYPVPYGNKIQAQVSARGYKELAMRSGKYKVIDCSPVYPCDHVKRNRTSGMIEVEFEEDVSKVDMTKPPIGYFAYVIDKHGELINSVYWTREQCESHGRTYSKAYNQMWAKHFDKMASKTVIKQLCQKLDNTKEVRDLISTDQFVFGGEKDEGSYLDNPQNSVSVSNSIIEAEVVEVEKE